MKEDNEVQSELFDEFVKLQKRSNRKKKSHDSCGLEKKERKFSLPFTTVTLSSENLIFLATVVGTFNPFS